eukprot:650335-Hanusia_phi.AAC.1
MQRPSLSDRCPVASTVVRSSWSQRAPSLHCRPRVQVAPESMRSHIVLGRWEDGPDCFQHP